jgi:capsular exopolysaccharide synthesis family protein
LPNQDLELAQNDLLQRMATAQQDIDKAQLAYQSALSESPNDAKRVGTLREEVSLNERLYLSLLEQFNRVRLASSILGEAIVIEHAATAPTGPSAPNWPMNLGLGALLGLVSGTGLAFFAARNDTRVYTSEELQALLPALLLGEIPQREKQRRLGKKATSRVFEDNTMELEGIRRVRVNLIALQQRAQFKAVVAVSAEPGEGKSTLVANLAASMARVGKRVAVVDSDMRLPTLHESFQLPNQFGLSSLLLDEQMDVHDVMHSPIPNVSVITSGVSPANPGELLGTPRMHSIINQLSEEFDMVLVDSPALLAAADGITVARITGHALFVASCQVARRETVHAASRQIIDLGVNLLGLVVNGAERPYDYHYHRSSRQKNRYLA